jgi:rhodanese-related sulfurtransferase
MQAKELMQRLNSASPPTVIDVRSTIEFRAGHIPGAIRVPLWKILFRLARLPQDKNTALVVTCEHGPRAQAVQGLLSRRGYVNLSLLEGHMAGWRRAGLKTDK